ncbi:hypothetical protein ILUMI_02640 [Ignelater luminosus]|uniref:Uncharacterized protein n=1 Tax=Ignelater luminosus TaxID=2038154 RepID=A0A8K0GJ42_IGNLU|nr:hypothetical protein ILUMI_02640 [Ignelater luminosus]
MVKSNNFEEQEESPIRIILDVRDQQLQERLLGKGVTNLETTERICGVTKIQARDLQGEKVDAIRNEQKSIRSTSGCGKNIENVEKVRMNMTA